MQTTDERFWGAISKTLILIYVTIGGGYEIVSGILNQHVQASLVFTTLSAAIFLGRIKYAKAAKATRTIWADYYGAVVMGILSLLHIYLN